MFRVPSISGLFKWRQFEPEVILLAAFFVGSQPPARAIMIVIIGLSFTTALYNSGEAVEHRGNESPVP